MTKPTNIVISLDPGPVDTAWVTVESPTLRIVDHGFQPNVEILGLLTCVFTDSAMYMSPQPVIACEMVQSFGMSVGASVFETVYWIGRFNQKACDLSLPFHRIFRKDIKMHLCQSMRAKDANIRQALIDKLGPQGKKSSPGPTYGISKHSWAALAVGVAFIETTLNPAQSALAV